MIKMNEQTKRIVSEILKYKNKEFLAVGAIMEFHELIDALMKNIYRKTDNRADIFEEMADAYIMLEFLKNAYGFSDTEIWDYLNKKMPEKWSEKIEKWKVEAGGQ